MDNGDPLFAALGELPPMPDGLWERALSVALDPNTPPIDPDLVPEMGDEPVFPDDEDGVVLFDEDAAGDAPDTDVALDTDVVLDDSDSDGSDEPFPDLTVGDDPSFTTAFEPAVDDGGFDPGLDPGADLGGDLH
ncbi:hypothetical protein [Rhodococcus sp. Q]|uniref:hypothetical protein n=1 Tax=Rhodococcus sp. Q TaxID=2502252 RepID=UPI0010F6A2CD|nr:hypothetical protein [Rhodococcus sp. Q]